LERNFAGPSNLQRPLVHERDLPGDFLSAVIGEGVEHLVSEPEPDSDRYFGQKRKRPSSCLGRE
jgi:hypothetical protein